ncbi:adenosine receptor A2a-like [Paramacrobiotus metropolitanus]|uniref:adenosine receptor A2a-like n=1 Tax=Paramacrobiotus metropolitanus TaxID=2943436 RepID=UPI002445A0A1|nr:adenosine receptor A2a-like [Paramacrobiotus metropolitanus]
MDLNTTVTFTNITRSIRLRELYPNAFLLFFISNISVGIIGAVLCLLLIVSICATRTLRGGAQILIIHLQSAEAFLCILNITSSITMYFPRFQLTSFSCSYFFFFIMAVSQVHQWSSFLLAVNRVVAIIFPLHYHIWTQRQMIVAAIGVSWVLPLCINIPIAAGIIGKFDVTNAWPGCAVYPPKENPGTQIALLSVGFYFPLAGTFFCYLAILLYVLLSKYVKSHGKIGPVQLVKRATSQRTYNKRILISKSLFISSLWFLACYLPFSVVSSYFFRVVMMSTTPLWLRVWYNIGYLGGPVAFFTLCKDYRRGISFVIQRCYAFITLQDMRIVILPLSSGKFTNDRSNGAPYDY